MSVCEHHEYADWRQRQLASQGGVCAICGVWAEPDRPRFWRADHDHACCPVGLASYLRCGECERGILCGSCNALLAGLERPEWREKAQRYLDDHEGHTARG